MLAWIAKIASHPLIARVLYPAAVEGVRRWLDQKAKQHEMRAAVTAAKSAKTIQELKDASRKLSDATRR